MSLHPIGYSAPNTRTNVPLAVSLMKIQRMRNKSLAKYRARYTMDRYIQRKMLKEEESAFPLGTVSLHTVSSTRTTFRERRVSRRTESAGDRILQSAFPISFPVPTTSRMTRKPRVQVHERPKRAVNAPDLRNDFYVNPLDWSRSNVLAVALDGGVILWNPDSRDCSEIDPDEDGRYISSVKFAKDRLLAVGDSRGIVQLWDVERLRVVRTLPDRGDDCIGALAWNGDVLSSGSRKGSIRNYDIRCRRPLLSTQRTHGNPIYQLQWSLDGKILASGGYDKVCLWDSTMTKDSSTPLMQLAGHGSVAKAMAWSPHNRHVLATGGGNFDGTIRLWNVANGSLRKSLKTDSQICGLIWNARQNALLSCQGLDGNKLCLWEASTLRQTDEFRMGDTRPVYMALDPKRRSVCVGCSDETLRFWDVFEESSRRSIAGLEGMTEDFVRTMQIR